MLDSLAMVSGYEHCGAILIRQVKAYIRLFGYHITRKDALPDGKFIYYAEDNDDSQARLAPAWEEPNGTQAYYATWIVKKVDK